MGKGTEPIRCLIFQMGRLDRLAEVQNAITLADQVQSAYDFTFDQRSFPLPERYRMANGGFDLDNAVVEVVATHQLPRPIVFVTSEPYTDASLQHSTDLNVGFYFSELSVAKGVSVISTHLWSQLPGNRRLQSYVLYSLASIAFDICADIAVHDETRGCPFDYCDLPEDIFKALDAPGLCAECSARVDHAIRSGDATVEQTGAAERLLNRASGKKQAFVAMPFCADLEPVFLAIRTFLTSRNWKVVRADEMCHPRSITDAILHAIYASDLVIADLTHNNPNVFYEVGWAHAVHKDVILLTQELELPIDVKTQRAVIYAGNAEGLDDMVRKLARALRE